MNSTSLNEQLLNLYLEELPELYNTISAHATPLQVERMHGPFMMHVFPEYTESKKKLMVVGMETHGWEDFKPMKIFYTRIGDLHRDMNLS
jgi:hypothetical protein